MKDIREYDPTIVDKIIINEGRNLYIASTLLCESERDARSMLENIVDEALRLLYSKETFCNVPFANEVTP